ncbi:uncharacterized protein LOC120182422 [Hibiscus syriacus]|uniref:uncharacterized protein LOC120182422 n=1 Tax=Hibiscus syriacus TaxID=106335 RepID=UPI0019247884|nr:uncharacterized protein LOC120182422 [Hibiscus syriacus]
MVSKTLVNRLRSVLSHCIDDSQAAFVPGRLLFDNFLVAHEVFHYLKSNSMDLPRAWVIFLMSCVSSCTYCIRINGHLTNTFSMERGLRQGDRPSTFLFVLCIQGLSSLLSEQLQAVLALFAGASGQHIKFSKSSVYFSGHTPLEHRMWLCTLLGVQEVLNPGNYLGLPLIIRRNKTASFSFIRDRVGSRVRGWSKNLLSYDGREIFIKSVDQALRLYLLIFWVVFFCRLVSFQTLQVHRVIFGGLVDMRRGAGRYLPGQNFVNLNALEG